MQIEIGNIRGAQSNTPSNLDWLYYEPEAGDVVEREHPFTKMEGALANDWKKGGTRWRPGKWDVDTYGEAVAHKPGSVIYRVIHVAKLPKPYPRRVFYTRQFVTPDGLHYKKSGLLVHSIGKFRSICYRRFFSTFDYVTGREPVPEYQDKIAI